jgi:hypothetical protein
VLAHLLGGALLVAIADRPCSELIFDGALGACTERPTVYSASCGGTRELPTRHREPPSPSVQRGYPHRLGGGVLIVDGVGPDGDDWLCRRIGGAAPTSVGMVLAETQRKHVQPAASAPLGW